MRFETIFAGCILLFISLVFAYVIWQIWGGANSVIKDDIARANKDDMRKAQKDRQMMCILLPIVIVMFLISFVLLTGTYVYFNYIGVGIATGGALFSYIGILFKSMGSKKAEKCTMRCMGHVAEHVEQEDSDGNVSYIPVVTYTVNGNNYSIDGEFGGGKKAIPQIGDTIEVFYDPLDPEVAQSVYDRKGRVTLGLMEIS